jgi:hypothetical protein
MALVNMAIVARTTFDRVKLTKEKRIMRPSIGKSARKTDTREVSDAKQGKSAYLALSSRVILLEFA